MLNEQNINLIKSYARSFVAAVLAVFLAGETDLLTIFKAGLAAIVPPLLRWLDPNDSAFGRGSR